MKKIFIFAIFASVLASCTANEGSNVDPISSDIEVAQVDTFTTEQRNAIDYCYSQVWEWDYLYTTLPMWYQAKTENRYKKLEVLVWLDQNNAPFGDTIEEGDAWEIICNQVLHIEY